MATTQTATSNTMSINAAKSLAKNYKRHGRKRAPMVVKLRDGGARVVSKRTARKLIQKRGNKIVPNRLL